MRALACVVLTCLAPAIAAADQATDRVSAGEEFGKQGRWTEAIESFKAADKIEKRAKHACLIALAYIRRELWPQAEVFLTLCHERATSTDAVPDWVPLAEQQLRERLVTAKVAPVQIRVLPEAMAREAAIGVSSFAPDELFAPRTIHLPRGQHLITATVDGRQAQQTIEIVDDSPREVVIDFDAKPALRPTLPTKTPPAKSASKVPWIVMGAGGALMLGGAGYHMFVFKPTRDDLADASDRGQQTEYDRLEKDFDSQRRNTIVFYSVGAAMIATGVALKYTVYRDRPEQAPRVGAAVGNGGGMVVVEWSR